MQFVLWNRSKRIYYPRNQICFVSHWKIQKFNHMNKLQPQPKQIEKDDEQNDADRVTRKQGWERMSSNDYFCFTIIWSSPFAYASTHMWNVESNIQRTERKTEQICIERDIETERERWRNGDRMQKYLSCRCHFLGCRWSTLLPISHPKWSGTTRLSHLIILRQPNRTKHTDNRVRGKCSIRANDTLCLVKFLLRHRFVVRQMWLK